MTEPRMIRAILGQLAGSASMCWSICPSGVFDSEGAKVFVDQAEAEIRALLKSKISEERIEKVISNYQECHISKPLRMTKMMAITFVQYAQGKVLKRL